MWQIIISSLRSSYKSVSACTYCTSCSLSSAASAAVATYCWLLLQTANPLQIMSDSEYYNSRKSVAKESSQFDTDDEVAFVRHKNKKSPQATTTKRVAESDNESTTVQRNKKKTYPKPATTKRVIQTDNESTVQRNKPRVTTSKRVHDSDDETASRRKQAKDSKTSVKRKQPQSASSSTSNKKSDWRLLDSESEDEAVTKVLPLKSSYTKRVADGVVRRTADLEGDLYLDLKLYQVDDIKKVHPLKRHEKAVLALRYQADHDSPQLAVLQQLLKCCKKSFVDEGYFFGDKAKLE